MISPEMIRKAGGTREGFPPMETSALCDFVSLTFPCAGALKEEGNRTLWNAIFNSTAPHFDEKDQNKGIAVYTSTKELMKHMEDWEDLRFTEGFAAMGVWLE